MFEKFTAPSPRRKRGKQPNEMPRTEVFLISVKENGFRLSYAALTRISRIFEEDASGQIEAQRGAKLVQSLPVSLQPYVCRKDGSYAKGISWEVETPEDLRDRPVIQADRAEEAVQVEEESRRWKIPGEKPPTEGLVFSKNEEEE